MRQKESLTGDESVRLLRTAKEHGCETVDLTFSAKTRHDLIGTDDNPLPTASLTVFIPIEFFLKHQNAQLEGGQRTWNWEVVYDASEDKIKHLYLLSTQWNTDSVDEVEQKLARETIKYNSLMENIKEEEE